MKCVGMCYLSSFTHGTSPHHCTIVIVNVFAQWWNDTSWRYKLAGQVSGTSWRHKLAARIRSGGDCPPEFFFNQFGTLADELFPGWGIERDGLMALGARDVMLCRAGPSMFTVPPSKELGTAWHLLLTSVHGKNAFLVDPVPAISESTES